jgi:DNA-binding NtrC family response regulator
MMLRLQRGHGVRAESSSSSLPHSCWRTRKKLVENAIRLASGNKTEAANRLQINRRLFCQEMIEHQIKE